MCGVRRLSYLIRLRGRALNMRQSRQVIALKGKAFDREVVQNLDLAGLVLYDHKWYTRFVWWLAKKVGVKLRMFRVEGGYESVVIDSGCLLERIKLSEHEIRKLCGKKAKYLLVGHDVARELWGEVGARSYLSVPMEAKFMVDGRFVVAGFEVVTIPWMDGWVLVPELG